MRRWKLTIEYDGGYFIGWQRQDIPNSVQQVLEESIFKLSGSHVRLHVAGRTDSGVHAMGQVAHFDLEKDYAEHAMRNALNVFSRPHPVAVLKAEKVSDDFHARFSALKRTYRYMICNRSAPPVIGRQYMWHIGRSLDIPRMEQAAAHLIGTHDFTSFRALACQAKHAIRSIDSITFTRDGDHLYIDFEARSFLHHQVRNIVGTLKKIGEGSWPPERMKEILDARDRAVAGPTAPAHGLHFVKVTYPVTGSK